MDEDGVLAAVREAKEAGEPPADVIAALQAGMKTIGDKYEAGEYFLSELIMSAEIFKRALDELGLDKSAADTGQRGTVVLGTVHTDIHDIGKNIVASVLSANGFKVVDLGVDVPVEKFVEAAKESGAKVIGLSCLLTTAFPAMQDTIAAFAAAGLRDQVTIMIGGGPVTAELAEQLGADGAGASAQEAVNLASRSRRRRCRMIPESNDPRWERLRKAIALEPVDKVPVVPRGRRLVCPRHRHDARGVPQRRQHLHAGRDRLLQTRRQRRLREQPQLLLFGAQLHLDDRRQASRLRGRPRRALAGRGVGAHEARGLRRDPRDGLAGVPGAVPQRAHPPGPPRGVRRRTCRRAPR